VPREAVAYWLTTHQQEIRNSAAKFNVDEYAIAGIIAWEALENPQAWSISSVGPGKMHLEAKSGQLSWPEAVEGTGRMPPLSKLLRKINLKKPAVAIDYIGASLDVASAIAELHGWSIRNNAGVLGQAYHSFTPEQWDTKVAAKAPDEPFELVPVTMGEWIPNNMPYLKKALGGP
jgi:hypothetical protein